MANELKRKELNDKLDAIEKEEQTLKVELHYKDGRLVSGNMYLPILNK